jgi:hypothetical protein
LCFHFEKNEKRQQQMIAVESFFVFSPFSIKKKIKKQIEKTKNRGCFSFSFWFLFSKNERNFPSKQKNSKKKRRDFSSHFIFSRFFLVDFEKKEK